MDSSYHPRRARKPGEESRALIKQALRARRGSGRAAPTVEELADEAGLAKSTVQHHLVWMVEHNEVRIEQARREIVLLDPAHS